MTFGIASRELETRGKVLKLPVKPHLGKHWVDQEWLLKATKLHEWPPNYTTGSVKFYGLCLVASNLTREYQSNLLIARSYWVISQTSRVKLLRPAVHIPQSQGQWLLWQFSSDSLHLLFMPHPTFIQSSLPGQPGRVGTGYRLLIPMGESSKLFDFWANDLISLILSLFICKQKWKYLP